MGTGTSIDGPNREDLAEGLDKKQLQFNMAGWCMNLGAIKGVGLALSSGSPTHWLSVPGLG